jgi:hypothetical protein
MPFDSLKPFKYLKAFACLSPEFWILTSGSLLHALCPMLYASPNPQSEIRNITSHISDLAFALDKTSPICLLKTPLWKC